jgi:hypothetical protein
MFSKFRWDSLFCALSGSRIWLLAACVLLATIAAPSIRNGQSTVAAHPSEDGIWEPVETAGMSVAGVPQVARRLKINQKALGALLDKAPLESDLPLRESSAILNLPFPDGSFGQFRIQESPILEPALAARYPEIHSYRGECIDNPSISLRFDWSPFGFHAKILTNNDTISVYSLDPKDISLCASYFGSDVQDSLTDTQCLVDQVHEAGKAARRSGAIANAVGGTLRTYRIAISTTQEYTNSSSLGRGTIAGTIASINTWLNGINAIYERELSVRLTLVGNNDQVIYTAEPDPFTNGNTYSMLNENRPVLRDKIGQNNYDVGHVLGTGGAGIAYVGVVCDTYVYDSLGPLKGGGASLMNGPVGNDTWLGLLAHELGHQFGARHSFNAITAGSCGPNRSKYSAVESGGGVTIMGYAGVCSPDNISLTRSLRFHSLSTQEINDYLAVEGTCATTSSTGNSVPTINAGANYTIPSRTPFALTATGSDADAGDTANLTYAWEQYDVGGDNYGNPAYTDAGDPIDTTRPIFRPYSPATAPTRYFPSLTYILNNANIPPETSGSVRVAESLPQVSRTLNFRATIRDNRGGVNEDAMVVTVSGAAGPFVVTQPNAAVTWNGGSAQTINWNVANTHLSPISCANVRISLSVDGGNTFPYILATSTANDGTEPVVIPTGLNTSSARIKVESVGNIFFDISDAGFSIVSTSSCSYSFTPSNQNFSTAAGTGTIGVTTANGCVWTATSNAGWIAITGGGSGSGNGTVQISITANSGPQRTGTINIAGQMVSISQASGCTYSLSAISQSFASAGGTGQINVTSGSGCPWTAISNVSWITISGGGTGTGAGAVNFNVAANNTPQRTGTITVAGQTFTIQQSNGCSFSVTPANHFFNRNGGGSTASVSTGQGCAWTVMSNSGWLSITTANTGNGAGTVQFSTGAFTGPGSRTGTLTIAGLTVNVTQNFTSRVPNGDFDGDGRTDYSVWTPSSGLWRINRSSGNILQTTTWGLGAAPVYDLAVPGDYDGDGKADIAVWRTTDGYWYILQSSNNAVRAVSWGYGLSPYLDVPVPGDYDGDGKTDIAVWRKRDGFWFIIRSSNNQMAVGTLGNGGSDRPVPADYDGDGKTDLAVWRDSDGLWQILQSSNAQTRTMNWGSALAPINDLPVPADYDGDGKADIGVWRQSTGYWYILKSSNGQLIAMAWGAGYAPYSDLPVPGDYDGDGKADFAIWRQLDFMWYVLRSSDSTVSMQSLGQTGDITLPTPRR